MLRRARAGEEARSCVDAYAVWCGPCKQLDRMTFADPTVGAWARKNVVAAKVDAEKGEGRRLAQRYAVRAFPTILFLDPSGNELDRISGVFPPEDFIRAARGASSPERRRSAEAIARPRAAWDAALAGSVAAQLAQRNDLARLAPIARRAVEEDPVLLEDGAREAFLYLVSLEDGAEKLSPETLDLIESLAPRLSADPRVVILRLAASREQARRGDAAAARASALAGLEGAPRRLALRRPISTARSRPRRGPRRSPRPPVAAARKAVALGEKSGGAWAAPRGRSPSPRRSRSPARNRRGEEDARRRRSRPASSDAAASSRAPPPSSSALKDVPGAPRDRPARRRDLRRAATRRRTPRSGGARRRRATGRGGLGVRARRRARARERAPFAGDSTRCARRRARRPPEGGRPGARSVRAAVGSSIPRLEAVRRHRDRPPGLPRDEDEEQPSTRGASRGGRPRRTRGAGPTPSRRVRSREEVDERREPVAQRHHLRRDHLVRGERRRRDDREEPEREP
ncbi:MAG: thioredoxin fold domain-containing protein [Candidatus Moduliflexus flocculans]|nr:thioredoxin fold domain-containing protein [Candidatus Moduliflexus flocculans]